MLTGECLANIVYASSDPDFLGITSEALSDFLTKKLETKDVELNSALV